MSTPPALRFQGVRKRFLAPGRPPVLALDGIDLDVAEGEFLCLLGPSGCGKSTLLDAAAGFVEVEGRIELRGVQVRGPGPDRAMVFQEYALFPWMTVAQNLAFGLELQGRPRAEVAATTGQWLQRLGLSDFRERHPKELSGGMRQRVAIARALALGAPVLLMDEPFGALDALTRRSLQETLLQLWSEPAGSAPRPTVLFVTHGIDESVLLADRVAVMTWRPGTLKRIVPVALPRPRDPTSPQFAGLVRELTALVMEEQTRHVIDDSAIWSPH